jgi:hypothetical protein
VQSTTCRQHAYAACSSERRVAIEHRHQAAQFGQARDKPCRLCRPPAVGSVRHEPAHVKTRRQEGQDARVVGAQLEREAWVSFSRCAVVPLGAGEAGQEPLQVPVAHANACVVRDISRVSVGAKRPRKLRQVRPTTGLIVELRPTCHGRTPDAKIAGLLSEQGQRVEQPYEAEMCPTSARSRAAMTSAALSSRWANSKPHAHDCPALLGRIEKWPSPTMNPARKGSSKRGMGTHVPLGAGQGEPSRNRQLNLVGYHNRCYRACCATPARRLKNIAIPAITPAIVKTLHSTPWASWPAIGAGHESVIAQPIPKIAAPTT